MNVCFKYTKIKAEYRLTYYGMFQGLEPASAIHKKNKHANLD